MDFSKQDSRRIRRDIRQVLLKIWDPIGIGDEPRAQDEYDSYIGGLYELLVGLHSDQEIEEYLWAIIKERIQVHPQKGATEATVKALRSISLE
jgi:hypothetical protein